MASSLKKVFLFFAATITLFGNSEDIRKSGDVLLVIMPLSAFGASLYMDDSNGSIELVKSLSVALAVTETLKYATHKRRPDKDGFDSFPSAHTSMTFSTAAYIHKRYGIKEALLPYLAASYVGYSRVYSKRHYAEDVVAGAAVGVLSSFWFTTENETFCATPLVGRGYCGIELSARF